MDTPETQMTRPAGAAAPERAAARAARARRRKAPSAAVLAAANDSVRVIGDTAGPHPAADARLPTEDARLPTEDARLPTEDIYLRIGNLTRVLHDALRELGYDKDLAATREHLPDARDRLAYIARVTGEAAEKVLNAVDHARSVQDELAQRAGNLQSRWRAVQVFAAGARPERATPAGRQLVDETCEFFASLGTQADRTQAILTDIMMAQDFHDLTGQVIRKVVALAQNLEEQLVRLLIESTPIETRKKVDTEKLSGPVVNAEGRDDVVTDQAQVDDLLATLGF
jgi:chemotaxis protein CheZ